jgi:hypothetical protein
VCVCVFSVSCTRDKEELAGTLLHWKGGSRREMVAGQKISSASSKSSCLLAEEDEAAWKVSGFASVHKRMTLLLLPQSPAAFLPDVDDASGR